MPLVSVVVITYNSSKTILDTLDSIAAQSYPNIELIVTDDASKDNTVSVVEAWMAEHAGLLKRVELVTSVANSGVTANVNRGVRASRGEWIKMIAGDDMLMPNAIERFVAVASEKKGDFFFARMELFHNDLEEDVSVHRKAFYEEAYHILRRKLGADDQYNILRYSNNFCPAPASFFSRAAFDNIGGFDLSIAMAEDFPLWLKATEKGYLLHFIDEPLVKYRVGAGSVQRSACFSVTKRLIKYKYLLKTFDYGICDKVTQLHGYDSLSNKVCFRILKCMAIPDIYAFRNKASAVAFKYGVQARRITFR